MTLIRPRAAKSGGVWTTTTRRPLAAGFDTWCYAEVLYKDDGATLGDLREAVETLEEAESVTRRVYGGAHPLVPGIGAVLQEARAALRARETPSPGGSA